MVKATEIKSSARPAKEQRQQPFFEMEGRNTAFTGSEKKPIASFFTLPAQPVNSSTIQPKLSPRTDKEELLQKEEQEKGEEGAIKEKTVAPPPVENKLSTNKNKGELLPGKTRADMESAFGADFSDVKIHTDDDAAQLNKTLNARAFTVGQDIYFSENSFDPESGQGKRLLAHELTHTIQQGATNNSTAIQKDEEQDTADIKNAVNQYGNECYNNLISNVDNALSLFRNWYFSKDEGDETFFNEIKTIVAAGRSQSFGISTVPSEAGAFTATAAAISSERVMFLTSFVTANGVFRDHIQRGYINTAAEIMERDYSADWGQLIADYRSSAEWRGRLHTLGLPVNNNALQETLLSQMIFAYNRWELHQHTQAYQGIYSMADPDLRHMQAGSEATARELLARPRIDYGDILFPVGDYTLRDRTEMDALHEELRLIDISVDVPLYGPVNVGLAGTLTAGYNVSAGFGPIMLRDINIGMAYFQTPSFFNLFNTLSGPAGPLTALRSLTALYGLRLRGTTTLHVPASAMAELYLRAALSVGMNVGLADVLTLDLASVSGSLDAIARAEFGANFTAPIEFMVDHGNVSFSKAMSLDINQRLAFELRGGITARILTFDWSKTWDIASWEWAEGWNISSGMNLLYVNGIQGDAKKVVNFEKIKKAVSELQNIGSQMMHLNTPGAAATSAPSPRQELHLDWPKPRASSYPMLYLTRPGETRSQNELRSLYPTPGFVTDNGRQTMIEPYSPIERKRLPFSLHEIGLADEYQIGVQQNFVGPLQPNVDNPGGRKINQLVSVYGINSSVMNGDHVYELQVGGVDSVDNLWPLDAATNQGAGNFLKNAIVTDPSTGQRFRLSFLKNVVENNPGTNYFFQIVSYR